MDPERLRQLRRRPPPRPSPHRGGRCPTVRGVPWASTSHPAVSTSAAPRTSDLLLKVTPPRLPRNVIARVGLGGDAALREPPIVVVQAPAGFGKTSVLAQLRRDHLAH